MCKPHVILWLAQENLLNMIAARDDGNSLNINNGSSSYKYLQCGCPNSSVDQNGPLNTYPSKYTDGGKAPDVGCLILRHIILDFLTLTCICLC